MLRKRFIIPLAIALISAISFQSCIGSFSLTNKVLTWNKNVNNKFVNELVFFAFWVLPVYEVTALADLLVINSIEFWSGNIPLEAENKVIYSDHGDYHILASSDGYDILTPDGQKLSFSFDADTQTWSFSTPGHDKTEFLKFKDDQNVMILTSEGVFVDVELSPEGVNEFVNSLPAPMMASLGS